MTSTTTAPPATLPRRISVGWAASAFILGGVVATAAAVAVASDDAPTSTGAAVVARPTAALVVSADAAERWAMTDVVAVEVASADAAEHRAVAEQDRRQESCRGGSPDAVERCVEAP